MSEPGATGSVVVPVVKKITRGHSCTLCQLRKVRCDGQKPCSTCVKGGQQCVAAPPRRRRLKEPLSKEGLLARLKRYESLLLSHGVNIDTEPDISAQEAPGSPESVSGVGKLIVEGGHARYIENNLWSELTDELEDGKEIRPRSSDSEQTAVPAPSGEYAVTHNLIFGRPVLKTHNMRHPEPVQIFRLWQTFLDNVNPLTKLFHAPTVQQMVLDASTNIENIPRSTEALIFAIYLASVVSLSDQECESIMGEPKLVLAERYSISTQQALTNAEVLRSSNLVVLQALTLFLLAMRQQYDPHSLWLLSGLAVRIGQRIGLHREIALRELSVFEAEMRRRLWWQILILDYRSAQLSGVAISSEHGSFDVKAPMNVNDSDLSPTMKDIPREHTGVTEMLFCSVRYEIGEFMRQTKIPTALDRSAPAKVSTSMADWDTAINDLESRIEEKYLRYCDPSIPLHLFASGMARSAICQMRLVAHHPRQYPDKGASLPQYEKDMLFSNSLKMIELDNLSQNVKSIQGYRWHLQVYFQLDAFIYLLSELAKRTEGELVDRAWQQINEAYEHHNEMLTDTKNALYFAIGNLAIKAWEKRATEVEGRNQGLYQLATPSCITTLRSQRVVRPMRAQTLKMTPAVSEEQQHEKLQQQLQQQPNSNPNPAANNAQPHGHAHIGIDAPPSQLNYEHQYKFQSSQSHVLTQTQFIDASHQTPDITHLAHNTAAITMEADSLLPPANSYIPLNYSPADWEYWQTLLEGCELPSLDGDGSGRWG